MPVRVAAGCQDLAELRGALQPPISQAEDGGLQDASAKGDVMGSQLAAHAEQGLQQRLAKRK